MQNDKYKFKVTRKQMDIIYELVQRASLLPVMDMQHKLLVVNMISIHKKMLPKWTYPSAKNSFTFTAAEAIAFWLMFQNENWRDAFVFSTMNPILTDIHKQYL